jgi:hypothetical protein
MRPNKFRNLVNKAIEERLTTGSNRLFTPYLVHVMHRKWGKWAREEGDFRCGEETYGYANEESVQSNLFYISDRWRCAVRLRWILDGLVCGKI